jgi:putative transposase
VSRWGCFYHVVWATKRRLPLIEPHIEPALHEWIREKSGLLECNVLAVNGTADHIHIAVSIPPKIAVMTWIKQVKGFTAFQVNASFRPPYDLFKWQGGYGVFTIGPKNLPVVLQYIGRQKERHAANDLIASLEDIGDSPDEE